MAQSPGYSAARSPGFNEQVLFWASFLTLIAAGMGFAIRGDILTDWGRQFGFTQTELGAITGMGLVGFGVTIIFFSFFADLVGYGKLMVVAFLFHALSVAGTLAAPFVYTQYGKDGAYWCLFAAQCSFALGNGTCEAVINPLTASLFPHNKTHWLNILHAGWPGGLVLGALVSLGLNQLPGGVSWQVKWGIIFAPMLLYGVMMLGRRFPTSEATASGVSLGTMFATLFWPILLFLFFIHALVGYVELGTDSWIVNITDTVLENKDKALMAFIWTNVLMFTLRFFAGPIVHKISPLGLLFGSAVLGAAGLYMMGMPFTNSTWAWMAVITVYGIGKTFYWPTMLGVISERYPQGGALALGICGGIGMLSAGILGGPVIGYKQDYAAVQELRRLSEPTYERYKADEATSPLPDLPAVADRDLNLPKVAGLDNGKVGVLQDYVGIQKKRDEAKEAGTEVPAEEQKLQLQKDIDLLKSQGEESEDLDKRLAWWKEEGKPHAEEDAPYVDAARLDGGKKALTWTSAVPAVMAVCYLLLILYFLAIGGYKAEVLATPGAAPPDGGGHFAAPGGAASEAVQHQAGIRPPDHG